MIMNLDWIGLAFNVGFLFVGLAFYLVIYNKTKLKKKENMQYPIMAACVLAAIIIGGVLRKIIGI